MVRHDSTDVESLLREVEYIRSSHVELRREHRVELEEKDERLHKRLKRAEKAERAVATLKRTRHRLQEDLRVSNDKVETSRLEVGHQKREVQLAHEQTHAAKRKIKDLEVDLEEAMITNINANMRLNIKRLCLKYHPDRGDTILTSTEVARDLIELLSH